MPFTLDHSSKLMKDLRMEGGSVCQDCKTVLVPKVMSSAAGWYVGTSCKCGPYSRESAYYKTKEEVERLLGEEG
jgi:RNase P subunit RPR2